MSAPGGRNDARWYTRILIEVRSQRDSGRTLARMLKSTILPVIGLVSFLRSISPRTVLELDQFKASTERSDGTSATMRISGRFVDGEGLEVPLSGRVQVAREGGEWCVSGERDGFRTIQRSAFDLYGRLSIIGDFGGDMSIEGIVPPRGRIIGAEAGLNTPPPGGPPTVHGDVTTTVSGLQYIEIALGNGPRPEAGQTVLVRYTMWLEASGAMIDSSHGGEPFEFVLGGGLVVDGFDEGVATMREGGRRRLIIPPRLEYGDDDDYEDIAPNSTLIFDVEVVEVR